MWNLEPTEEYERRFRWFCKNRPAELQAALDNLDTYQRALRAGAHPLKKHFGFMHLEPHGVVAIDQKGGGPNLRLIRLYVFPDSPTQTLHQIIIGEKPNQARDIKTCIDFVQQLRRQQADEKSETQDGNRPDSSLGGD